MIKINPIFKNFKKYSRGLKIFVIVLAVYGLAILGGNLLSIILIIRGEKPLSLFALLANLVIFLILMWVFLLTKKKAIK